MGEVGSREGKIQKSYFDVLGICCPSEVPLIEKILKPLDGIQKVSVVVPSKTVIVVHDTLLISQLQIVKALNQARLEATVRAYGTEKIIKKWPSPYILACGVLLLASVFQRFFRPLRWLAVAAVIVGLPPIVLRSIAAIRRFTLDINILMLIAVSGAVALRDYSEAGFIVFLFTMAEWLESRASHKATAEMSALMSMAPQKAILAETGEVVDAQDVKVNTILAVKAGELIPIDGTVVEGRSEVNEQSLTGESFPVAKQAQSLVWAGTLNIDGYINVKTTALAEHSAVARMARLVEDAQNSRSKTQRLIDSCAKYYTPAVVIIAAGVTVIPLILRVHNPKHWFKLALVLLVSACPCALVLSTPVATFCALLKAARTGLLVKGGDVLEALARTRVVAFDKTGTITKGEFTVMELRPICSQEVTLHKLLYWISSIESKSSHPMAAALVEFARSNSIEPKPENVSDFHIYPGEGVYGEIDGKKIYIGNKRIATRAGCNTAPNMEGMKEAVTLGYVFSGAVPIGMFTLSDTCRSGAAEAIRELKSLGVKTAMLTGDSTAAAMHAQNQLGHAIEILHAELLPEDKVQFISDLKTKEGPTTMVGDGMNDAPALAAADVGISMGISGSAVAMETSHITLMSNDILKIPKAIRLARKTHNKIIGNIMFSVITKIAIVALAIAGHPLLWAAVLADVGTCLLVILNSMLLLRTRAPKAKKKCCRAQAISASHKHSFSDGCGAENCGGSSTHEEHVQRLTRADCCSKGTCGSGKQATNTSHEHVVSVRCGAENCCDGTHEEHVKRPVRVDCCAKGTCGSDKRSMNASREHMVSVECSAEHHSNGKHEEQSQRPAQLDCCAKGACGSGSRTEITSDEHVVVVGCGAEDSGDGANKEHLGGKIACRHGTDVGEECDSQGEKKENGGCCKRERKECGQKDGCSSSSQGGMEGREIGGCCKSYRKECGKREGCCGGAVVQLPEIITE